MLDSNHEAGDLCRPRVVFGIGQRRPREVSTCTAGPEWRVSPRNFTRIRLRGSIRFADRARNRLRFERGRRADGDAGLEAKARQNSVLLQTDLPDK